MIVWLTAYEDASFVRVVGLDVVNGGEVHVVEAWRDTNGWRVAGSRARRAFGTADAALAYAGCSSREAAREWTA